MIFRLRQGADQSCQHFQGSSENTTIQATPPPKKKYLSTIYFTQIKKKSVVRGRQPPSQYYALYSHEHVDNFGLFLSRAM